jgi:nucleoside-diphosphate-sugar epimerase
LNQALIGHTGFVGSNLARQSLFDAAFSSRNIGDLKGRHFERIVCAGIPAVKWLANQQPAADRDNIGRLTDTLEHATADCFVLISTIDIYPKPIGVDETDTPGAADVVEAYGRHRLEFENFVSRRFPRSHLVRLPALFGPGLKKNAIYDLMHDNRLEWIHPDSSFQWYPVTRLTEDLALIEKSGLRVVNIATEPLATRDIQQRFFPGKKLGGMTDNVVHYDVRTRHGRLWERSDEYCMSRTDVLAAMADYLQGGGQK